MNETEAEAIKEMRKIAAKHGADAIYIESATKEGGSVTKVPVSSPYWTGNTAKEDAIGCATARAKFGRGEIQIPNNDNSIERVIPFDQTAQL